MAWPISDSTLGEWAVRDPTFPPSSRDMCISWLGAVRKLRFETQSHSVHMFDSLTIVSIENSKLFDLLVL